MKNQIVPIVHGSIGSIPQNTVDAKQLHAKLQVRRDFSTWIKSRIAKYDFIEGHDFEKSSIIPCSPDLGSLKNKGLQESIEYTLSIGMAKELAMVENNDMGKEVRRYFIECERRALEALPKDPLTLTTTTTRKPLTDLVKTWAAQTGQKYSHCYRQVNAHFNLEGIAELPEEWIQDACHFVQSRIDANNQAIAIAQAEQAALPQASLAELVPVHPPQNTCPFTLPTFTPEEMIAGGQLAKLFDKHFANLDKVIKESDHLYQYFQLWGNMGNKKMGLSPEVQMLFENGNHAMQMVKASMFMGQHALKSALNVKSSVAFV